MTSITPLFTPSRRGYTRRESESGITLVELLVAITMLAIIVLFSSNMFISSFRKNANMENRNKATQIANEQIAIAKQSPYKRLYTPTQSTPGSMFVMNGSVPEKCLPDARVGNANSQRFGGYNVQQPLDYTTNASFNDYREFKGLVYCQEKWMGQKEADQVGTSFWVQTDIVYLNETTSDMPTRIQAGNPPAVEKTRAKRVVVTVRWRDTESGEDGGPNQVSMQTTITPKLWECPATMITDQGTNTKKAKDKGLYGCQH